MLPGDLVQRHQPGDLLGKAGPFRLRRALDLGDRGLPFDGVPRHRILLHRRKDQREQGRHDHAARSAAATGSAQQPSKSPNTGSDPFCPVSSQRTLARV